ncbi:hypothetical protein [Psychroserpens sp.]
MFIRDLDDTETQNERMANPPFKGKIDKQNMSSGLKTVTNTSKTE